MDIHIQLSLDHDEHSKHMGYSKEQSVFIVTHLDTHIPSSSSALSCSCVFAVKMYNTRVAPLSAFVARILLRYSSSPRQVWTCRFFLFFFFSPSSSLPLGRKARSWQIKGIARRPHERQRRAAVLNSPERLFQSERPDQQRQDPQGRGAGRRSLGRIKVPGLKLRERSFMKLCTWPPFCLYVYFMWGQVLIVARTLCLRKSWVWDFTFLKQ